MTSTFQTRVSRMAVAAAFFTTFGLTTGLIALFNAQSAIA
jgi:hypothetical protein